MKRKSSVTRRLLSNFNRLIPFIGFLLVIAGVLGLIFVQKPLEESQDLRSDAYEVDYGVFFPNIMPTNPNKNFFVNEASTISLDLNTTESMDVQRVHLIFNIINSDIDSPLVIVNAGSGFRAESIEDDKTTDGWLFKITAVPNNIDWLTPPDDTSFVKIDFTPSAEGTISINFDRDNTYLEVPGFAYTIDAQTINYDIGVRPVVCNDDVFTCDDGSFVVRIPPECSFEECPNTPLEIKECNERCDSNSECEVGYRCFDTGSEKRCRLATSPTSSNCSELTDQQCNRYCSTSEECRDGLGCWDNRCRNPENIESATCANLTPAEQEVIINSCGDQCSSNAECAINLRCYNNTCRLASNPSSLTCSSAEKKIVAKIYDKEGKSETNLTPIIMLPIKKGDNIIPDNKKDGEDTDKVSIAKRVEIPGEEVPVDETIFDLVLKMLKDKQQSMPTTIIIVGVMLLAASLLTLLIVRILNFKPRRGFKIPVVDSKTINIKSHKVSPGGIPRILPKSSLKSNLASRAKSDSLKNNKVKETMALHKIKPKVVPRTKPKVTHKVTPKPVQDVKVKKLLKKLNQQSKEQNKG